MFLIHVPIKVGFPRTGSVCGGRYLTVNNHGGRFIVISATDCRVVLISVVSETGSAHLNAARGMKYYPVSSQYVANILARSLVASVLLSYSEFAISASVLKR
jgi:hypothetical protein